MKDFEKVKQKIDELTILIDEDEEHLKNLSASFSRLLDQVKKEYA